MVETRMIRISSGEESAGNGEGRLGEGTEGMRAGWGEVRRELVKWRMEGTTEEM